MNLVGMLRLSESEGAALTAGQCVTQELEVQPSEFSSPSACMETYWVRSYSPLVLAWVQGWTLVECGSERIDSWAEEFWTLVAQSLQARMGADAG